MVISMKNVFFSILILVLFIPIASGLIFVDIAEENGSSFSQNDTLQSVTDRGASTTNAITVNNDLLVNDGKLGVGTNNPLRPLHVVMGNTQGTPSIGSQVGIFQNNPSSTSNSIFAIISGHTGSGAQSIAGIQLGDKDNINSGYVYYYNYADALTFGTNRNERMRISSTGNVGIGTDNPLSTLSVVHSGDVNSGGGFFIHNNQSTQTTGWRIVEGQPGNYNGYLMFVRQGASTPGNLYIRPSGQVDLPTGASVGDNEKIASVTSGALAFWTPYVTTNPGYSLFSFRGNTNQEQAQYRIQGFYHDGSWNRVDLAYFYALPTNSRLRLFQNLQVDGDVGIGTSTPNQKLQVDGNINASGTVYASAFVSHSPIRLGEDSLVGHTRICYKATNGDVVLKEIQLINGNYQDVYTKDTQGICDKAIIKQSVSETEFSEVNGEIKEVKKKTITYETLYSKQQSEEIIKEIRDALQVWQSNITYNIGDVFQYNNKGYEVIQDHTSQEDWKPHLVPTLYKTLILHQYNEVTAWTQPQGSHDCYPLQAQVTFNGKTYQSQHSCNVWQPPTLWSEIQ